ncbi:MAG TPA: hypothetical protein VIL36_14245 [Acidimicrobiales bacterium]
MNRRFSISWVLLIWLIIGVIVAVNKDYARSLDTASEIATFLLAVLLWPIPATDGVVLISF